MYLKEVVTSDDDYNDTIQLFMDGEEVFSVFDGEPEDNTLARNFNDCFNVAAMMRSAHAAGLRGEPLTFESVILNSGEEE